MASVQEWLLLMVVEYWLHVVQKVELNYRCQTKCIYRNIEESI